VKLLHAGILFSTTVLNGGDIREYLYTYKYLGIAMILNNIEITKEV